MIELKSSAPFANVSGSQLYFTVQKNNNVMIDYSFGIPTVFLPIPTMLVLPIGQSGSVGGRGLKRL